MFLSEVAPKSFCVKFSGLKVRKYSTYRLIFGLFLKLKKFMVLQWRFQNYFASKTKKILLRYYFSQRHAIKNSSGQMRQISHMIEMIQPTIGWRRNERGTHKNTHGSWILWSVLRVRLRTMHSLFCITSWLPYITLYSSIRDFFSAPGKIAHGSMRLSPRSLASSRGCSLAIINLGLQYTMRDKSVETLP